MEIFKHERPLFELEQVDKRLISTVATPQFLPVNHPTIGKNHLDVLEQEGTVASLAAASEFESVIVSEDDSLVNKKNVQKKAGKKVAST